MERAANRVPLDAPPLSQVRSEVRAMRVERGEPPVLRAEDDDLRGRPGGER